MHLTIVLEREPSRLDVARVYDAVDAFNVAATGDAIDKRVAVLLRDADGHVHGGVVGDSWGGWFHIGALWVAEPHRRQGHGSRLLETVETAAREAGCRNAYLETFSFQAPQFYERHGYEVFASLPDHPRGHTQYFLRKSLARHAKQQDA